MCILNSYTFLSKEYSIKGPAENKKQRLKALKGQRSELNYSQFEINLYNFEFACEQGSAC